jgi:hypothetical protein
MAPSPRQNGGRRALGALFILRRCRPGFKNKIETIRARPWSEEVDSAEDAKHPRRKKQKSVSFYQAL